MVGTCARVLLSKSRKSWILQHIRGGKERVLGAAQRAVLSWLSLVQVGLGEGSVA